MKCLVGVKYEKLISAHIPTPDEFRKNLTNREMNVCND